MRDPLRHLHVHALDVVGSVVERQEALVEHDDDRHLEHYSLGVDLNLLILSNSIFLNQFSKIT